MNMALSIGQAAKMLGVSIQTLRRWDHEGILKAQQTGKGSHRYYERIKLIELIEQDVLALHKVAQSWAQATDSWEPLSPLYCRTIPHLELRLHRLEQQLAQDEQIASRFQLISSVAGEIGNNSFDHNLGNWPDVPGIFFGHDLKRKQVVLADRGQGILTTLKRVRPELKSHAQALETAFTEVVSGRSPENRGNGLKYVKKIISENDMHLQFQSGDTVLTIQPHSNKLHLSQAKKSIQGCLTILTYSV